MMNVIAIDVASEVSSVCILDRKDRKRLEEVPTRIRDLRRIISEVPRPRQVVFEEGTQAAWLWSELHRICDDILVCDPRQVSLIPKKFKSDRNDAKYLARLAQCGLLKRVWHGGKELQGLREAVRTYQSFTEESVRLKNQIKAVFRGCGIAVGDKAYSPKSRKEVVAGLKFEIQRERVLRLGAVLDEAMKHRAAAFKTMVRYARRNPMYKPLRQIDGIGPVFASMFISEVGDPWRFRSRAQLWSYAGLAITTFDSSQFELKDGRTVRKCRVAKTRGLVRTYNRTLKYVLKQAAMTLSRTKWSTQYRLLLGRSKNANNAQLTLARKLATVMLHIAKTGQQYDVAKVFKAQQV